MKTHIKFAIDFLLARVVTIFNYRRFNIQRDSPPFLYPFLFPVFLLMIVNQSIQRV